MSWNCLDEATDYGLLQNGPNSSRGASHEEPCQKDPSNHAALNF